MFALGVFPTLPLFHGRRWGSPQGPLSLSPLTLVAGPGKCQPAHAAGRQTARVRSYCSTKNGRVRWHNAMMQVDRLGGTSAAK